MLPFWQSRVQARPSLSSDGPVAVHTPEYLFFQVQGGTESALQEIKVKVEIKVEIYKKSEIKAKVLRAPDPAWLAAGLPVVPPRTEFG